MQTDFLTKIVEHKKEEIAAARKHFPESDLRKKAAMRGKSRMFFKKLERPGSSGINIIAEIKRASPSKGKICPDLNPAAYARQYEDGGAAALSVLTDQAFFSGSIDDLTRAREAVTIPVLRKDFLISSYQIYEASVVEADAVLLIARILSQEQMKDYLSLCNELKIDALVEIHSEKDLKAATLAGARLIGINNRDLSTFKTDINTTIRMAALLEENQVAVAASGIKTRKDIKQIQNAGIWNFLIGESLVRSSDPSLFLMKLMGKK